jgi:hypothetical protein
MDFTVHLDGYERLHTVVISSFERPEIGTATHPYCRLLFWRRLQSRRTSGRRQQPHLSRPGSRRGYNAEPEGHEQTPSFAMPMAYMLDTTVFNHVLRDSVDVHTLRAGRAYSLRMFKSGNFRQQTKQRGISCAQWSSRSKSLRSAPEREC